MNHTLTHTDTEWQQDLERRASQAEREELVRLVLRSQPPPPTPLPSEQLFGMGITCLLIGALIATALWMSFH